MNHKELRRVQQTFGEITLPFLRLLLGAVVGLFFCSTIALAGGSFIKYVISLSVVPLKLNNCWIFFLSSNSLI